MDLPIFQDQTVYLCSLFVRKINCYKNIWSHDLNLMVHCTEKKWDGFEISRLSTSEVHSLYKPVGTSNILREDGKHHPKMVATGGRAGPKMVTAEGETKWNTNLFTT